jgi:hypothetical protein
MPLGRLVSVSELQPLALLGEGVLWEDGDTRVHLVRPGSSLFEEIVRLRETVTDGPGTDAVDEYSTHYALYCGDRLKVWFRVTRAGRGLLDCEASYPEGLVEAFRPVLAASGRLGRHPEDQGRSSLVNVALRCGWGHQLKHGARLDVINSRQSLTSYYQRLGYRTLPGWSFVHPRTNTIHDFRAFVPACDAPVAWQDLFSSVPLDAASPLRERLQAYARGLDLRAQ